VKPHNMLTIKTSRAVLMQKVVDVGKRFQSTPN